VDNVPAEYGVRCGATVSGYTKGGVAGKCLSGVIPMPLRQSSALSHDPA
jgi:hypothetical protein